MPRTTLSAAVASIAHLLGAAPRKRSATASPSPPKPAPAKATKPQPSPKPASFAHLRDWNPTGTSFGSAPSRANVAKSWDRAHARVEAAEGDGGGKAAGSSWDRAASRIGVTPR